MFLGEPDVAVEHLARAMRLSDDAVATFNATERRAGKTVIRVRP